ncbi:AI-2E family transporter [Kurthia massiliensis]|uniref:AI-2E family transporter n=1 Tax=Kurthia massiliensis TaxID=1033739 RepID=UPI000288F45A|nr:AI-2E family transporter [Kurthia massiliensis]
MLNKRWFQIGLGILIAILIIKFFLEINHIFKPLGIIIGSIFVPLLAGGILFYVTEPLQRLLEKRFKFKRWTSILAIVFLMLILIFIAVSWVAPYLTKQITLLIDNIPSLFGMASDGIDKLLKNRENLPPQVTSAINDFIDSLQDYAVLTSKLILDVLTIIINWALLLILIPFFFIYMLKDHEKFQPKIYNIFSGDTREWVKQTLKDINDVLSSYVQGQMLVSAILAILMFIGYKIIGLEYALLLCILAFFLNMVPFIGPWMAFLPAFFIGLVHEPMQALWVCIITLVVNQIDSNFVTPNVMGKSLDIHPLTVITVILAAGNILGFVGILLGVPIYAVIKVIVINVYEQRRKIREFAKEDV